MAVYFPRFKDAVLARQVFGPVPATTQLSNAGSAVQTAQHLLNIVAAPTDVKLKEDGQFGRKTFAAVTLYQRRVGLPTTGVVDKATWWALRRDVWGVVAWAPIGTNKYTGKRVDRRGLAFETARLEDAIYYAFGFALSANMMVDRNARGTKTLSDHARGQALDLMTWYLGSLKGMAEGHKLLNWLSSDAAAEYAIVYALFDFKAWYRGKDKAPRDMTKARAIYTLTFRKIPSWLNTGKINYNAPSWAHETHVHISTSVSPDWVAPAKRA